MQCLSGMPALGVLAAVLLAPGISAAQVFPDLRESLPQLKWDLETLKREPFKLIKATPDPRGSQVRFIIEFTRPPTFSEQYEWERHNGAVVFRFLDEDGLVLRSVQPSWQGEFVPKKGARMALVLPMPDQQTLRRTRTVVAE